MIKLKNTKMKKLFIIILLFNLYSANSLLNAINNKKIMVLPFENESISEYDYLSSLIQNTVYIFFKKIINWPTVSTDDINKIITNLGYNIGDINSTEKIIKMGQVLGVTDIVRGKYKEEKGFLVIDFEVIDTDLKKVTYRSSKFGEGNIEYYKVIENIIAQMIEDFTGQKPEYGSLSINTDLECVLLVDNDEIGTTPQRLSLKTGSNRIRLFYIENGTKKLIYDNYISLAKNKYEQINIKVFKKIEIKAEEECLLYLDNKFVSHTPYKTSMISGSELRLKAFYINKIDGQKYKVYDQKIKAIDDNIKIFINVNGKIALKENRGFYNSLSLNVINAQINQRELKLPMGYYNIQGIFESESNKIKKIFMRKNIYLKPSQVFYPNTDYFTKKQLIGLIFVPSLSQFYHKQLIKGSIMLTSFLTFAAIGGMAPLFGWLYYNNVYAPKANTWNKLGPESGLDKKETDSLYKNVDYIVIGIAAGSSFIALIIYLWSLIDGAVYMNTQSKILKKINEGIEIKGVLHIKPLFRIKYDQE